MTRQERLHNLPQLLQEICAQVLKGEDVLQHKGTEISMRHGEQRFQKGYRPELVLTETRLLQREISVLLQEHLLGIDLSTLIVDSMRIADLLSVATERAIHAFYQVQSNNARKDAKAS